MLETISNPSEWDKDFFDPSKEYLGILTEILAYPTNETDYDVTFKFLCSNGYMVKEFVHTCNSVFTSGKLKFRHWCRVLLSNWDWNIDDDNFLDDWEECCKHLQIQEFLSNCIMLNVNNECCPATVWHIEPCRCSDDELKQMKTLFADTEPIFKLQLPIKINRYVHELLDGYSIL